MTTFQKVISCVGAAIDYIPGLATIVNGSILIYQRAHRVNQAANPVNKGWKSDLKIYALSKDKLVAKASLVPVIGTIGALITHVARHQYNLNFKINKCLTDAARVNPNERNHSLELVRLYLARNPNLNPEELVFPLCKAATLQNMPLLELLLEHAGNLSAETVTQLLGIYCQSREVAQRILAQPHDELTAEHQTLIVRNCHNRQTLLSILPDLPDAKASVIQERIASLAIQPLSEEELRMLINRSGVISDANLIHILKFASLENRERIYELTQCNANVRLAGMGHHLNSETFPAYRAWVEAHEAELTDEEKALVLKPIFAFSGSQILTFAKEFATRNRFLSGPAAVEVLKNLHFSYHLPLYQFYLDTFENLSADNLREYFRRIYLPDVRAIFLAKFPELAAE